MGQVPSSKIAAWYPFVVGVLTRGMRGGTRGSISEQTEGGAV